MTDCVNIKYILLNELNADLKKTQLYPPQTGHTNRF